MSSKKKVKLGLIDQLFKGLPDEARTHDTYRALGKAAKAKEEDVEERISLAGMFGGKKKRVEKEEPEEDDRPRPRRGRERDGEE